MRWRWPKKARDLGGLLDDIGRQGALRDALAGLPGPVMRPPDPARAQVIEAEDFAPPPEGLPGYMLPVVGRVLSGFGETAAGQARSAGLTLVTRPLAQAVAPRARPRRIRRTLWRLWPDRHHRARWRLDLAGHRPRPA
ncbi:hypothetical protein ACFSTD_19065 [Novosphingobium colocasiae]